MKPRLELKGAKDIEKALLALAGTTAKRTARRAMASSLEPVLQAAQALAPVGPTGNLRKGVAINHKLNKNQAREAGRDTKDVTHVYVGSSSPHAHLVEFGTGPRQHKKTGKFVGAMPPNAWMRPAWDSNAGAVLNELRGRLWEEIEATIARVAKRQANAARKAAKAKG
jgi:HK97 gp10 family phage protein